VSKLPEEAAMEIYEKPLRERELEILIERGSLVMI
jgi:hypothetical protein